MGKLKKRKAKKDHHKKRAAKRAHVGTGQDDGKGVERKASSAVAYPSVSLETAWASLDHVRSWHVHNMVLNLLADAVNPSWVAISQRSRIKRVVMVVAAGLTEAVTEQCGGVMPFVCGAGLDRIAFRTNSSKDSLMSVIRGLMSVYEGNRNNKPCTDRYVHARDKAAKQLRKQRRNNNNLPEDASAAAVAPADPTRADDKEEEEEEKEEEEEEMKKVEFCLSAEGMQDNDYPLADTPETKAYARSQPLDAATAKDTDWDVAPPLVAIDCEMVRTEVGLELARLTLVSEDGKVLEDMVVVPDRPVLDHVTKYSGITAEMLAKADARLVDAQRAFQRHVSEKHILVGRAAQTRRSSRPSA